MLEMFYIFFEVVVTWGGPLTKIHQALHFNCARLIIYNYATIMLLKKPCAFIRGTGLNYMKNNQLRFSSSSTVGMSEH